MAERLILGVGNPDRGDDGAGWLVAARLRALGVGGVETVGGSAPELLAAFDGADDVVLIDAACSGAPVGSVHVVDCGAGEALPAGGGVSSHGLGVAEAIGLARALACLPARCVVYAIEGADFSPGAMLSPEVAAAAEAVVDRIVHLPSV